MKIHEYQAKTLLQPYGVSAPRSRSVLSPEQAEQAAKYLIEESGRQSVVVKAQIHAGGRGKGRFREDPELGGVVLAEGANAALDLAGRMLGNTLATAQTGPSGQRVRRVLIEEGVSIARELYLGAVVDRELRRVCLMASSEGGVEIEKVAAETPGKILKEWVDPLFGLLPYQARRLAYALGLSGECARRAVPFFCGLAQAFVSEDATLAEINPLVVTKEGRLLALDAKINLDDNADYRHKGWADLHDPSEEQSAELEARQHGLSYVKLDGNIGCMVNGAGLAMATMDIIKLSGGEPANFLDVGGSADKDRVAAAFKIIVADSAVRGIFVNIFGGIVLCDNVAQGIVEAARDINLEVPLVVRLEGTNVEAGRAILERSDLNLIAATDMADGARKIVERSK